MHEKQTVRRVLVYIFLATMVFGFVSTRQNKELEQRIDILEYQKRQLWDQQDVQAINFNNLQNERFRLRTLVRELRSVTP